MAEICFKNLQERKKCVGGNRKNKTGKTLLVFSSWVMGTQASWYRCLNFPAKKWKRDIKGFCKVL